MLRRNPQVRRLWFAQIVSELGDWLNFVALVQLIQTFSNSARDTGLLIILQMMPMVIFSPIAGVVADRFDRRKVMIIADLLRAVIVLGFLLIDRPERLWMLYVLAGMQFTVTSFFEPSRAALIPNLASKEELLAANGLSSVTWSVMLAVGGGLGGLISGLVSNRAAFIVDAASFLTSATLLLRINNHRGQSDLAPSTLKADLNPSDLDIDYQSKDQSEDKSLWLVLKYLWQRPDVLSVLLVKSGICITAGGVWLLSIIYGQKVFPVGKDGSLSVGLFYCVHGLGAIVGAVLTGRFFRENGPDPLKGIQLAFLFRSGFFLLWGAAINILFATSSVMCVTACGSLLWVMSTTLLQRLCHDSIRGRIFALENAACTLAMAISITLTGRMIDVWQMSASKATLVTSAMALLIAILWSFVVWRWQQWQKKGN